MENKLIQNQISNVKIASLNQSSASSLDEFRKDIVIQYQYLFWFLLSEARTNPNYDFELPEVKKFNTNLSGRLEMILEILEYKREVLLLIKIVESYKLTNQLNLFLSDRPKYDDQRSLRQASTNTARDSVLHIVR